MEQLSRIAIDLAFCPSNHSISGINDPSITFPSTVLLVHQLQRYVALGEADGDTLAGLPLMHS